MKLLEHEGKQLLKDSGILVPNFWVIPNTDMANIAVPVVLKSQVPTGGRGKAGGIIVVRENKDIQKTVDILLNLPIKNYTPQTILAEELLNISAEFYVSILVDRQTTSIQLVANKNGGVEVETNNKNSFFCKTLTVDITDEVGDQLAIYLDIPSKKKTVQNLVANLYTCIIQNDALLIEINPLIFTNDRDIVAGDCKIELDDSAAFRHPDWQFEHGVYSNNFVTLDPSGTVATIANGAGLAMATVDAVADFGLTPANFLDIGGGANSEVVLAAFRKIMGYKNVQAIIINIFAGITHCDEVAKAIITAKEQIDNLPPLFIRLSGTNSDIAKKLLDAKNIPLLPTLESCISAAKAEVDNG